MKEVFAEVKRLFPLLLCTLLLAACGPATKTTTKTVDLKQSFGTYTGTFKLHDVEKGTYTVHNPDPEGQRYAPASTFKVLHSLIALQTGVVADVQSTRRWDGTVHPTPAWNKDQTLETAVKNSVIWYFQDLARELGREREQAYLDKVGFGNRTIGPDIATFWLDGSLQISVDEQLEFMTRLYKEELPFDKSVMQTVKSIITIRQDGGVILAGKTGSAERVTPHVGWYVGYLVADGKAYTFVTRIAGAGVSGAAAKEISENALRELGLLK